MLGDAERLRQVLINLIANAIKFTARGQVQVSVRLATDEAADPSMPVTIEFCITDSGIGIATEQQDLLFRPFSQVDSGIGRRYGGTGLTTRSIAGWRWPC